MKAKRLIRPESLHDHGHDHRRVTAAGWIPGLSHQSRGYCERGVSNRSPLVVGTPDRPLRPRGRDGGQDCPLGAPPGAHAADSAGSGGPPFYTRRSLRDPDRLRPLRIRPRPQEPRGRAPNRVPGRGRQAGVGPSAPGAGGNLSAERFRPDARGPRLPDESRRVHVLRAGERARGVPDTAASPAAAHAAPTLGRVMAAEHGTCGGAAEPDTV